MDALGGREIANNNNHGEDSFNSIIVLKENELLLQLIEKTGKLLNTPQDKTTILLLNKQMENLKGRLAALQNEQK